MQYKTKRYGILVPTLNAGPTWVAWIDSVRKLTSPPVEVLVIDSGSVDNTAEMARSAGYSVMQVDRNTFNHGGTRERGRNHFQNRIDYLVCLTQDALLVSPDAVNSLLGAFDDPMVGAAYGRQLPSKDASPLAEHARLFNYHSTSFTRALADRAELGIKTCFMSNSFAAYRMVDLDAVEGFPGNVILGEDTSVAAKLLLAGKAIRYQADACVYHSHNYTALEEFRRYFDTGVFHARERWLLDSFGGASGEGFRFVKSELRYLLRKAPLLIPSAMLRTTCKIAGYRLGRAEARLPVSLKRHLSMFRGYWG